jgi:hypothetical protein
MKICFKCGEKKSLSEYYKHKKMSDGHLNKCKSCSKKDAKDRQSFLYKNTDWVEKERKRNRDKYYRLGYKDRNKPTPAAKKQIIDRYNKKYPEKIKAKNLSQHLKPKVKGNHLHHWSYNIDHAKDVIELSIKNHNKIHRYLKYDKETFMYKTLDGKLLDTKEKHLCYISNIN